MGVYINKGIDGFASYTNGEYVDKTELIALVNSTLNTADRLTCVSRPRRFGKTAAAQMLNAYYDKSSNSASLFSSYKIAQYATFEEHLNKYPSLYLCITDFTTKYKGRNDIVRQIQLDIIKDLQTVYPQVSVDESSDLMDVLIGIVDVTGEKFIMIIDEWDALCREAADMPHLMDDYVDLLRRLFKGSNTNRVFAGVYMTGILPIKKYGTQSALNDFREYSMTDPGPLAEFFGFTTDEVKVLCEKSGMDYSQMLDWYDGYHFHVMRPINTPTPERVTISVCNPNSVMQAMKHHACDNYWAKTEAFEALQRYIDMDFTGVKESLEKVLQGGSQRISAFRFGNDLSDVQSDDELFTLLVHLGYLSYDNIAHTATIPNQEIRIEFVEAVRESKNHKELADLVRNSDRVLEATLNMDGDTVAQFVDHLHNHKIAPNFYNNEQALRSVVAMAYLGAVDDYVKIQELPSGKGYADVVFIPRPGIDKPVLVVELKWNKSESLAIRQIIERDYPELVSAFAKRTLMVGISYDEKTKRHECKISQF